MKTIHKVGLGVAAGTLAVGGMAGATLAQADPTANPTPTASGTAAPDRGDRAGHGGRGDHERGGMDAAALASALGLDEATVRTALDAVRQSLHDQQSDDTTEPDPGARQQAFAEALAAELGVGVDQVTNALAALHAADDADRAAALADRLAQAVADGTLTQAEADAVQKAADAGVIGYGGRGGHPGR